jgi:eukaryotic-like serine/threonine-protein kinase
MSVPPGTRLGRYEIRSQLGAGGMGEVYLAQDSELDRTVALKVLRAEVASDQLYMNRFTQEARATSALNHPNIITIYEIGCADSVCFIATEFIDGLTLRQRLAGAQVNMDEALDIALQIAGALSAAHGAGVVHRDIKPENIMLRHDGFVKVLDFGLAKLTEKYVSGSGSDTLIRSAPDIVMGTPRYMSPEQARGVKVDERTDVWSLGVVLYEMVARRLPFVGETASDVISLILQKEPPAVTQFSTEATERVDEIVTKALTKDREDRYQTARDLAIDLKRLKQRLLFEAELNRSVPPEASRAQPPTLISGAPRAVDSIQETALDSLAVLPLVNACNDPNMEYLSDGITESLINSLSQLPKLRVVPRSTVFRYKSHETDLQAVGHELGVRALVTGKVCLIRDRLMIQADLIDVANDSQLWGERYNRKMSDIFDVEEQIAREISEKLQLKLNSEQKKRLTKRYTASSDAYEAYLKGRYHWGRRTEEGLKKSIECFQEAIKVDPCYALAYVGLADSYAIPGIAEYGLLPPTEAMPRAKAAAAKALEIDGTLAEAQTTVAHIKAFYDWDWEGAETEFQRAIELNPSYPFAHHWYALYLAAMERLDEAVAAERRAQELDPLSLIINKNVGTILYYARRFDQSIDQYKKTLELDKDFVRTHFYLGMTYLQKAMYDEAIAEYRKAVTLSDGNTVIIALLGQAHAVVGNADEAMSKLEELKERAQREYVPAFNFALIHIGLGKRDQAFEWLEKAYEERSSWLVSLKVEPLFDSIRSDPRFADLVRRVGL